ncbi:MAG: membrane protein insertase YidC [Puniceicoccales bacterium]|jgi:YidC/Oxa1 family membrane protein insertase|nr:membrane protein insertase YidC [Puniceicoccales bacterium]
MDKKSTTIGIVLMLSAFALFAWDSQQRAEYAKKNPRRATVAAPASTATPPPPAAAASVPSPTVGTPDAASVPSPSVPSVAATPVLTPTVAEKIIPLGNDSLRLNLTTRGGGIRDIALLKHADTQEHRDKPAEHPFLFNAESSTPALDFAADNLGGALAAATFTVGENLPGQRLSLIAKLPNGLTITRTYELATSDPNLVKVRTTFRADGTDTTPELALRLNTGTLPPTEGDRNNLFLGIATYDGSNFVKTGIGEFDASSGFLGMGAHAARPFAAPTRDAANPWKWVSVTNQYFAGILHFDESTRARVTGLIVRPIYKPGQTTAHTATGDISFAIPALAPGQEVTLAADYYVGPREYARLANLGGDQEKAVQFAKLYFISVDFLCKVFVLVLNGLYSLTGAWSLAIILLTVIIKAITWPLIVKQQRSAERMRQFQGPMKAIREKYKDDPKRIQQETMKLYQEHKINPLAGCLPVLIQIPIFTGLFFTFQSLAQLRFQSFLWVADLSIPDLIPGLENVTLPLLGVQLHILPLFVGATMLINMRLTPMPNVEGQQKIIFYGMMIMFPLICYGMPAALMLYYSVQNILTIFQTLITRRRFRAEGIIADATATPAPALANGTDAVKKKKKQR